MSATMLSSYWDWIIPSVIVVVLIIIGIILFLYLTINPNFEIQHVPAEHSPLLLANAIPASDRNTLTSAADGDTRVVAPDRNTLTSAADGNTRVVAPGRNTLTATPIDTIVNDGSILVNHAKNVWSIISKNAATADVHTIHGNVLPANITSPLELQCWSSSPVSRSSTLTICSRLGIRILRFEFDLEFLYGGSLNGRGAYLDGITVTPSCTIVAWCYVFNANVEITSVRNVGTSDNPIAAAHVELKYQLKALSRVEGTVSFDVKGDGRVDMLHMK
ncbi:unnamed protein product [Rotaria magnacalcarata]|uniref:Uncharacterized protein n=3 Tax=Rotaria magnacalcarata TaxID=392030 RepID=A0A815NCD6_9BILA|nr:unnamed protein product [Rotaria magnacalcarata]CAF3981829.1 unnamed protein product [Rotaria magnacalcarata]CAF4033473.1 unnamed protein product [Rotaria magnacalcarata]